MNQIFKPVGSTSLVPNEDQELIYTLTHLLGTDKALVQCSIPMGSKVRAAIGLDTGGAIPVKIAVPEGDLQSMWLYKTPFGKVAVTGDSMKLYCTTSVATKIQHEWSESVLRITRAQRKALAALYRGGHLSYTGEKFVIAESSKASGLAVYRPTIKSLLQNGFLETSTEVNTTLHLTEKGLAALNALTETT